MVEGVVSKPESSNSCCKVWKDSYLKLEEKRNALRQVVKLLDEQIKKIEAENRNLKEAYKEEKVQASIEREGKDKESAIRVSLEREILDLKSKISSLRQNDVEAVNVRGEVDHLNVLVAEGKKEIAQLKELLETEKRRTDAEARKEEAAQALKTVKIERSKVSDLRKLHKAEMDKVNDCRQQLRMLQKENEETKLKLASETSELIEVKKDLDIEKQRTFRERERADSEMSKAQASRMQAEVAMKQTGEEKSRADNLVQQLERKTCEIKKLEKQVNELQTLKFFIESCCGQHVKKTNKSKGGKENDKTWLEMIQSNANELKLAFECLKAKEVNTMLKMDKDLASRKEKSVDSNMMKSLELKNHLEIYRRKAMDEQCRADKMSLELEETKRKVEELQKNLCEFKYSMKLLKKKLKFEKKRFKHARQVAKLDKTYRSIIQQELGRLKLEFIPMSNRLDDLHKFVSTGTKGNNELEKTMNDKNLQSLSSKKNTLAREGFQTWMPDTFRQTTPQHSAPVVPLSGGTHITSLSGIESRLESFPGDSNKKMLQSCAVNSSTASFSDGQLVGSQEKAGLCLTATKLVGENLNVQPRISNLSSEVSKMKSNENLAMMAENSVKSPIKNHVGRANEKQQKRKRTIGTVESIDYLYPGCKEVQDHIEENLSLLPALNSPIEKPLEKSGHVISNLLQDPSSYNKIRKRKKTLYQKKTKVQHGLDDNGMKMNRVDTEVRAPKSIGRQPSQLVSKLPNRCQPCTEELNISVISEALEMFGNIADVDYMKLLDLDSAADEECYRRAMEMPLSPSLPDIFIPGAETSALNDFDSLVDEFCKEFPDDGEGQPQSHNHDVTNAEIKSYYTESWNFDLLGDIHGSQQQVDPCLIQGRHEGDLFDVVQAENNSLDQVGVILGMPGTNVSLSGCEGVGISEIKSGTLENSIPVFCVLFSNSKDCQSIFRIFSATRACIKRSSIIGKKDWMVQEILASLNMEHQLLPKEKTCVFFSLLLLNFTVVAVHKYGNFLNCHTCLDSFSGHICEAMLDLEIRSLFAKLLSLDNLLALIENFLVDGRILSCAEASFETLMEGEGFLRLNIPIDGVNRIFSLSPASTEYLVAGSSILASISKAVHRTDVLWEVSYSILRSCKYESSLMLTLLHIFAHIGGDQFFNVEGYSTLRAVLKSIILHLEMVTSSDDATYTPLKKNCGTEFVQCAHCPFSEEVMTMPVAVSFLLQLIQKNISNGIMDEDLENPTSSLNLKSLFKRTIPNQIISKDSSEKEVHPLLYLDCDASCHLKFKVSDDEPRFLFNPSLSDVTDTISLVELLACYMSWNWTFGNIISQLMELLKSSVKKGFTIVILLGQLGRFGVDAGGFEDGGVKILRDNLSAFLCLDTTIKSGLCVQIATVSALLGLLPFDFETIVQDKVSSLASSSHYAEVNLIKTWFSLLSPKQKKLSCNILQAAVCNVS